VGSLDIFSKNQFAVFTSHAAMAAQPYNVHYRIAQAGGC